MKAKEIREMTVEEIKQRILEEERTLSQVRFQHTISPLENPLVLRSKRREIARYYTILNEKMRAANV